VEEVWYVLEGTGKVWRCPPDAAPESVTAIDVTPGDALVIPTGWSFQFSAGPDGHLRFLCNTTPPWPGEDEAVPVERGGLGESTV
jgi:mannose-6-phosphate isomerase-like protein (cupin superfamily)